MALIQRISKFSAPTAAVAVVPASRDHTGVVYTDETGAAFLLHLAFHYRLRRDPLSESLGWIRAAAGVPEERLEHVAAMCERVWKRNQVGGLPYGFRYVASQFDQKGVLVLGEDEGGLTCATFVLAIYRSVGLELLKLEEWPERGCSSSVCTGPVDGRRLALAS